MAATRKQHGLHKRTRHEGGRSALREQLFLALRKLNSLDTCQIGFEEVEAIAGSLRPQGVSQCLSLVLEHRLKQNSFSRRKIAEVLSMICSTLRGLLTPHSSKMISNLSLRLKDEDHTVREAVGKAFGALAATVPMTGGRTPLAPIFKALFVLMTNQSIDIQQSAADALTCVVETASNLVSNPAELERLALRLVETVTHCCDEATGALIRVFGALFRVVPAVSLKPHRQQLLDCVLEQLTHPLWPARAAAVEALLALALRHRSGLSEHVEEILEKLTPLRSDKAIRVREAAAEALPALRQLKLLSTTTPPEANGEASEIPTPAHSEPQQQQQQQQQPTADRSHRVPDAGLEWDLPYAVGDAGWKPPRAQQGTGANSLRSPAFTLEPRAMPIPAAGSTPRKTVSDLGNPNCPLLGAGSLQQAWTKGSARLKPNPRFFKEWSKKPPCAPDQIDSAKQTAEALYDNSTAGTAVDNQTQQTSRAAVSTAPAAAQTSRPVSAPKLWEYDKALSKPYDMAARELMSSGDDLQLVRVLQQWPADDAVYKLQPDTASQLLLRLAQLIASGMFVECLAVWVGPLLGSGRASEQAHTVMLGVLGSIPKAQTQLRAALRRSIQKYQGKTQYLSI